MSAGEQALQTLTQASPLLLLDRDLPGSSSTPHSLTNPALLEGSQRACMRGENSCPLQGPLLPSHVQGAVHGHQLQTFAPTKARGPASQEIKPTDSGLSGTRADGPVTEPQSKVGLKNVV